MEFFKSQLFSEIFNSCELTVEDSGYVELGTWWQAKNVCSPFTRLYYIEDGEGELTKDGVKTVISKNKIYIIPSQCEFSYNCPKYLKKLYFHINLTDNSGNDLLKYCNKILCINCSGESLKRMINEYVSQKPTHIINLKSQIFKTITDNFSEYLSGYNYSENISSQTKAAKRMINENIKISPAEIASKLYISESSLRQKFKKETGQSIGKYIDEIRFLKARELLSKTNFALSQISESLGYYDQFHFSRVFKRLQGESPSVYRRSQKL